MITDYSALKRKLLEWINDGDVLAESRKFLRSDESSERSGLGDGQIANWRRRGLPSSFVEGAALYHCGQPRKSAQDDLARRVGMKAEAFWQVFVVEDAGKEQEWLDCTILRQWQGVRCLDLRDTTLLTHTAHRSTRKHDKERNAADAGGRKDPEDRKTESLVDSLVDQDPCFRRDPEDDSSDDDSVVVSWEVDPARSDYGYVARFPTAIKNNHSEAVGGYPSIPVQSSTMVTFLPPRLIAQMQRPDNPKGIPKSFATLLDGDPVRAMEGFLGIVKEKGGAGATSDAEGDSTGDVGDFQRHLRRLGSWFREESQVRRALPSLSLPKPILEHEIFRREDRPDMRNAFVTHIVEPYPFLRYFTIFGPSSS